MQSVFSPCSVPMQPFRRIPGAAGNYIQNAKFVRQDDGSWKEEGSKSYAPADGQVLDVYAYYPYVENADPTALKYERRSSPLI